jgi:hypothetical protein
MNDRKELKHQLIRTRGWVCEIQDYKPHKCQGGIHMNEVFVTRKAVMKAPKRVKDYVMLSPVNLCLCCGYSHTEWGHSRGFREHFRDVQEARGYDVAGWLEDYPGKVVV